MDVQEQEQQRPESQQDELENEYLSSLDRLAAGLSPEKWMLWQTIAGAVLGIVYGLCLFYLGGAGNLWFHGAGAGGGDPAADPHILQRNIARSLTRGRMVSIIALQQCFLHLLLFPWDKANSKSGPAAHFVCLPGCGSRLPRVAAAFAGPSDRQNQSKGGAL